MTDGWPQRPTLKDVARRAGVSVTTASVVLNDKREGVRVTDATRQKVQAAAGALGYAPNNVARGLRTRSSRTIGFVSDDVTTTPFAVSMLAAAQEEASRHDHLLFVVQLGEDAPDEVRRRAVDLLHQQQATGVVYATMYHRIVTPPPGLPARTVFLNAQAASGNHVSIVPDDYQGAHDAVSELLVHGHRRIAFLDDSTRPVASGLRYRGYLDALAAHGVEADPRLHLEAAPFVRGGLEAGRFFDLPERERPTGLFCYCDRQAMGAYRAARQRGLAIPRDLSVVGFDDQEYIASELDPGLTTMRLPHREMGRLAIRLLLGDPGQATAADVPDVRRMHVDLVRRDSVAAPRAGGDW